MPVFNDSASFSWIVPEIDRALAPLAASVIVVGVDDGSFESLAFQNCDWEGKCVQEVRCVELRGNVGHQSAIAIGLSYVHKNIPCDAVLVMDADGEDKPADAARLVERFRQSGGSSIVFAERTRRSEGLVFRVFYNLYRVLVKILTGQTVRVGNFSIVPRRQLDRLVISPNLWVHYAAAVFQSRAPRDSIPTKRGLRREGHSTMDFVALVTHGLSAISVFGATVGVRLTVVSVLTSIMAVLVWVGYFRVRIGNEEASLDVFLLGTGLTALFVSQMLLASFAFVFFILDNRTKLNFVPLRDYAFFINTVHQLYPTEE